MTSSKKPRRLFGIMRAVDPFISKGSVGPIYLLKTSLLQTHPGAKRSSSPTTGCSAQGTIRRARSLARFRMAAQKPTGCISSLRWRYNPPGRSRLKTADARAKLQDCKDRISSASWRETGLGAKRGIPKSGGARRDRTDDLMLAKHALSQLSYGPLAARCARG